jgi:hypothetical protein
VFTARCALCPYIKQIRFVFKGLAVTYVSCETSKRSCLSDRMPFLPHLLFSKLLVGLRWDMVKLWKSCRLQLHGLRRGNCSFIFSEERLHSLKNNYNLHIAFNSSRLLDFISCHRNKTCVKYKAQVTIFWDAGRVFCKHLGKFRRKLTIPDDIIPLGRSREKEKENNFPLDSLRMWYGC